MTRPDAYAVAAAMNARPLPADTDGGRWEPVPDGCAGNWMCDLCQSRTAPVAVHSGFNALCLPCAIADVQRAHEVADPHCTCPDCLDSHASQEVKS